MASWNQRPTSTFTTIPLNALKDWASFRRALKIASGIFVASHSVYSKYIEECGWRSEDTNVSELLFEVEKHRVDGELPCMKFFSLELCQQLEKAMDASGDVTLTVQEDGGCEMGPTIKESTFPWQDLPRDDMVLGRISKTGLRVQLQKDMLLMATVALLAYKGFLDEGPSVYAGLASFGLAGPLWLLLEQSYTLVAPAVPREEKEWTEVAVKAVTSFLLRPMTLFAPNEREEEQGVKDIMSFFDEQKQLANRMRARLKEQRLLRISSGEMLI